MPGFLYFVPNLNGSPTDQQIAGLGLGYALAKTRAHRGVTRGPDGNPGEVLAQKEDRLGYWAKEQTWRKTPKRDTWVGWFNDAKPKPEDLARPNQLKGHWIEAADGSKWLAPTARAWLEEETIAYCAVPSLSTLNESGEWTQGDPLPAYRAFWDLACRWWDTLTASADRDQFTFGSIHEGAVECLSINYRVSAIEADILGLLSVETCRQILDAACDVPTIAAWSLKKTPDGSSSPPGLQDDFHSIDQPLQTCRS